MAREPPQLLQSVLVAQTEVNGGRVLLYSFAYPVGGSASYASIVVSDPEDMTNSKSGSKNKFEGWCAVNIPEEFSSILFRLPSGDTTVLHTDYVWIHQSGLMIYGPNKSSRHWLEVFLRNRIPNRAALEIDVYNGFMLNTFHQEWERTFTTRDFFNLGVDCPPGEAFPHASSSSFTLGAQQNHPRKGLG